MRRTGKLIAMLGAVVVAAACEGPTGFTATSLGTPGAAGSITGTVTADGSGRGGVSVISVGADRDSTVTDAGGGYSFTGLTSGQYTVTVQVPLGFTLAAGQTGQQVVSVPNNGTATASFALQSTSAP